jgi:hypothetical protein
VRPFGNDAAAALTNVLNTWIHGCFRSKGIFILAARLLAVRVSARCGQKKPSRGESC